MFTPVDHSTSGEALARHAITGAVSRVAAVLWLVCVAALLTAMAGCAGYQIGANTLFRNDVQTVHVPIFHSDSFRRHLGERLTEAVGRKIETTSPYRLATVDQADSILQGRIIADRKSVTAENKFDTPRALEAKLIVQIQWIDRNGLPLAQLNSIVIPDSLLTISQAESFVPESGQSLSTTHQKAIERLAEDGNTGPLSSVRGTMFSRSSRAASPFLCPASGSSGVSCSRTTSS